MSRLMVLVVLVVVTISLLPSASACVNKVRVTKTGYYRKCYFNWWYGWRCSYRPYTYVTYIYRPCPPVDCEWGPITIKHEWDVCSVTCDIGTKRRMVEREIKQEAMYGGKECEGDGTEYQTASCDMKMCPSKACEEHGISGHQTHLKNYQNCFAFTMCQGRSKFDVMDCPTGTAFETTKGIEGRCTHKGLKECEGLKCEDNKLYSHKEDCHLFFKCAHNDLVESSCGHNKYFDYKSQNCLDKASARCFDYEGSDNEICKPGEKRAIIDTKTHYELCANGLFVKMPCPEGTEFNGKDCHHISDNQPCAPHEKRAIEGKKTHYELCIHGVFREMPCPPGTEFNGNYCGHSM